WYSENCDVANNNGGINARTRGWCGTIFGGTITPAGAILCGGAGFGGTNCAANWGVKDGSIDNKNMAIHHLASNVTELWTRWYYKTTPGYLFGGQKMMNITKWGGDITWFNVQLNCATGSSLPTAVPHIQIIHGPSRICLQANI